MLRAAARISGTIESEDWADEFHDEMAKRGICLIDHDWKHWYPENDKAPLAVVGLRAEFREYTEERYRVTVRKRQSRLPPHESDGNNGQSQMAGVEKARQLFHRAGLAFPSIPDTLSIHLKEVRPWLFATRPVSMSPYNLGHFIDETGPQAEDYVVLAHSGHGVNSYAVQYYFVHGCLRMFLHLGWGGVYMDGVAEAAKIRECFSMADRLVDQAERIGNLTGNGRLTVVASDFYGSYWLPPGRERPKLDEGRENLTVVLKEASDWLAAYGHQNRA